MTNTEVKHTIDLRAPVASLDYLQDLREKFQIPGNAMVFQNDDDYDLSLSWSTE